MQIFEKGGLTACQLYREADMQTSPASAKQGYIIALGVNDLKGKDNLKNIYGGEVGNVQTDIDRVNYKNNKGTLMGVCQDHTKTAVHSAGRQIFSEDYAERGRERRSLCRGDKKHSGQVKKLLCH